MHREGSKIVPLVSLSAIEGLFLHRTCSDLNLLIPSNIFHMSESVCVGVCVCECVCVKERECVKE